MHEPGSRKYGISGYKNDKLGLETDYPSRNGTGEPPLKRPRVACSPKLYVQNEGAGAVSPLSGSEIGEDLVVTESRTPKPRSTDQLLSKKDSTSSPLAVIEFQSVEKTMQSSPSRRNSQIEVSPHLVRKLVDGNRLLSEDSDPEAFIRNSKQARRRERAKNLSESLLNSHQPTPGSPVRRRSQKAPSHIEEIFPASTLRSSEEVQRGEETEPSGDLATTGSISMHMPGHTTSGVRIGSDIAGTEAGTHQSATLGITGNKPRTRPKNANSGADTFALHFLKYGILPGDGSCVAVISGNSLQLFDNSSRLSHEPICPDIQLSKILKIYHGSEDCLKLKLHMSNCQGQNSDDLCLELSSREDKERFLLSMPDLTQRVPQNEYMHFLHFCTYE